MTRPEASEQLSAYLDGELTDVEATALETELSRDPSLRAELDELENVVRFLREEGPTSPSMGFHARVMAAAEAEAPPQVSWWAWLRRPFGVPIEGLAVAAAAGAVLLLALPRGPEAQRSEWGELPEGVEAAPAAVKMPAEPLAAEAPAEPVQPPVATKPSPPPATGATEEQVTTQKKAPSPRPVPAPVAAQGDEGGKPVASVTSGEAEREPTVSPTTSDEGTAGEDPTLIAAPNRYDLRTDDPEIKRALLAAIARVGGTITGGEQSGVMTNAREQLQVRLSQPMVAEFDAQLRNLGVTVDRSFDDTRLYSASSDVDIQLVLTLEGGATTPSQAAPPKQRRALDFEAEALDEAL